MVCDDDDDNALVHALQQTHGLLCWMIIQSHDGSLRTAGMCRQAPHALRRFHAHAKRLAVPGKSYVPAIVHRSEHAESMNE
jgi:hypothetical protein